MEAVDILYHHIRFIKGRLSDAEDWSREDIDSPEAAGRFVDEVVVPHLIGRRIASGDYVEGKMWEEGLEFREAMSREVFGYYSVNFEAIPEYDQDSGKRNFDGVCRVCDSADMEVGECKKSRNYPGMSR